MVCTEVDFDVLRDGKGFCRRCQNTYKEQYTHQLCAGPFMRPEDKGRGRMHRIPCFMCGRITSISKIYVHVTTCPGPSGFRCATCSKEFGSASTLNSHKCLGSILLAGTFDVDGDDALPCPHCGESVERGYRNGFAKHVTLCLANLEAWREVVPADKIPLVRQTEKGKFQEPCPRCWQPFLPWKLHRHEPFCGLNLRTDLLVELAENGASEQDTSRLARAIPVLLEPSFLLSAPSNASGMYGNSPEVPSKVVAPSDEDNEDGLADGNGRASKLASLVDDAVDSYSDSNSVSGQAGSELGGGSDHEFELKESQSASESDTSDSDSSSGSGSSSSSSKKSNGSDSSSGSNTKSSRSGKKSGRSDLSSGSDKSSDSDSESSSGSGKGSGSDSSSDSDESGGSDHGHEDKSLETARAGDRGFSDDDAGSDLGNGSDEEGEGDLLLLGDADDAGTGEEGVAAPVNAAASLAELLSKNFFVRSRPPPVPVRKPKQVGPRKDKGPSAANDFLIVLGLDQGLELDGLSLRTIRRLDEECMDESVLMEWIENQAEHGHGELAIRCRKFITAQIGLGRVEELASSFVDYDAPEGPALRTQVPPPEPAVLGPHLNETLDFEIAPTHHLSFPGPLADPEPDVGNPASRSAGAFDRLRFAPTGRVISQPHRRLPLSAARSREIEMEEADA